MYIVHIIIEKCKELCFLLNDEAQLMFMTDILDLFIQRLVKKIYFNKKVHQWLTYSLSNFFFIRKFNTRKLKIIL